MKLNLKMTLPFNLEMADKIMKELVGIKIQMKLEVREMKKLRGKLKNQLRLTLMKHQIMEMLKKKFQLSLLYQ